MPAVFLLAATGTEDDGEGGNNGAKRHRSDFPRLFAARKQLRRHFNRIDLQTQ